MYASCVQHQTTALSCQSVRVSNSPAQRKVGSYSQILDVHFLIPLARKFEQVLAICIFDVAADGIVCSTKVAFGLEFEIGAESRFRAANVGVVTKFVFHGSEENAARIHVGLCDKAAIL